MLELLDSLSITERYFKEFVSKTKGNFTIQFESVPTRSDKGKTRKNNPHLKYLSTVSKNENGVYLVDKEHSTNSGFKSFCSRNKIKFRSLP